jgi:hypothetical protein
LIDHPLSPGGTTYAVLDANALLPPRLSDILFDLHAAGLCFPRWTRTIEAEFLRNWALVVRALKGAELKAYKAAAPSPDDTRRATRRLRAFRQAVGEEYELAGYDEPHISGQVPAGVHTDDVHVASAAILLRHLLASEGSPADKVFLVSSNVRHLAVDDMGRLGINVVTPGAFVDHLFQAAPDRLASALERTVSDLVDPPYTKRELLDGLELHGARSTVAHFRAAWNLPPSRGRSTRPKKNPA